MKFNILLNCKNIHSQAFFGLCSFKLFWTLFVFQKSTIWEWSKYQIFHKKQEISEKAFTKCIRNSIRSFFLSCDPLEFRNHPSKLSNCIYTCCLSTCMVTPVLSIFYIVITFYWWYYTHVVLLLCQILKCRGCVLLVLK